MKKFINKALNRMGITPHHLPDSVFSPMDRSHIRRTKNIRFIPDENIRRGGKYSYAEWAHVIGIFQPLMYIHLSKKYFNDR